MDKKFFQRGASFTFCILVVLGIILLGLGFAIYAILIGNWFTVIIMAYTIGVGVYGSIYLMGYHIHFQTDRIFTAGDVAVSEKEKLQHRAEIFYVDIQDVKLIYSSNNSKNKRLLRSLSPNTYFEFILKNDKKERLLILNHSKNQRKEMIAIINEKTGLNLDYDIMKTESHPPNEKVMNWFKRKKQKKSIKKSTKKR